MRLKRFFVFASALFWTIAYPMPRAIHELSVFFGVVLGLFFFAQVFVLLTQDVLEGDNES